MNKSAEAYELDGRAVEFVWKQLAIGGALSQLLRQRFVGTRGSIATWLPPGMGSRNLYDFEDGILPETKTTQHPLVLRPDGTVWRATLKRNMDETLTGIIRAHLAQADIPICLFEDNNLPANMLKVDQIDVRTGTYGKEVYRALTERDVDEIELISDTIRTARASWLFVGALTFHVDLALEFTASIQALNHEQLQAAAENAVGIIIGSYDGESFLVWRPA